MLTSRPRFLNLLAFAALALAQDVDLGTDQVDDAHSAHPAGYYPVYDNSQEPTNIAPSFMGAAYNALTGGSSRRQVDSKEYYYDNAQQIIGFLDQETGQTRILPDYGTLEPLTNPGGAFPPDDTQIELVEGNSLLGSEAQGSGTLAKRWNTQSTYLTVGKIRRSVDLEGSKFNVCGPGSQALFGLGKDNKWTSLSYQWKTAKKSHKKRTPLPVEKVVKQIKETLKSRHYAIPSPQPQDQHMQPVYRVVGEPFDPSTNTTTSVKQFLEYVPIGGDAIEPIVPPGQVYAGVDGDESPVDPDNSKRSLLNYFDARNNKPKITVGRYVVRNDADGFVEDARNFWSNLAPSTVYEFVRKGFFWAYPRLYNKDANHFVNDVDVALTEAHGKFHGFTTYDASDKIDFVNIPNDIAHGGYGPVSNGGKGKLGYWFIDACEVLPTLTDFEAIKDPNPKGRTFDPWWPVFKGGIHAAIALGRPVVSAWLDAANSDPAYGARPTYIGGGTGLPDWPLGKAAAVYRLSAPPVQFRPDTFTFPFYLPFWMILRFYDFMAADSPEENSVLGMVQLGWQKTKRGDTREKTGGCSHTSKKRTTSMDRYAAEIPQ
ncbi:hypothetical protein FA13DRAFT_1703782 [Coprinellus micaceus]|uniref:Uncharacterized protein n=1 Tax=Coprinellus micaceus TaxID=71717 RepID=A0A4Y7TZ70_COPMI|nr:hypothetical protein FA13DRAFT_1703782 [Coprinellus micaceus]